MPKLHWASWLSLRATLKQNYLDSLVATMSISFVIVQSLSRVQLFRTPWTAAHEASQFFTISWSLLKLMSIESVMPSNHLILSCLLLFCPQSFPASGSFPMNQLFTSGRQNIGGSASASFLPIYIQGWFPLGLTGLISLLSKGLLAAQESQIWRVNCKGTCGFLCVG